MKKITSESVFSGHPDKICDQVSDALLDAYLKVDPKSRVAIETLIKEDEVVIAGEVTANGTIDKNTIVEEVIRRHGYTHEMTLVDMISEQSADISIGVDKDGAGDQGIMFGFATDETSNYMPLAYVLARDISMGMDKLTSPIREVFGSDGKCQVTVEYDSNGVAVNIPTIVISQQTKKGLDREYYTELIETQVVNKVIPVELMKDTEILINPTGEFVIGGSYADCGLTGRKIIVDTYGGSAKHGGGAFSGKDGTKVDRSGAYYCRYVAKNIVASGLASKVEVGVSYAIGIDKAISISVDTFGTGVFKDEDLLFFVKSIFDFTPKNVKETMALSGDATYEELARYGHLGRTDVSTPWESLDKVEALSDYLRGGPAIEKRHTYK